MPVGDSKRHSGATVHPHRHSYISEIDNPALQLVCTALLLVLVRYLDYDLQKYYTQNISYHLDDLKREGMALFLKKAEGLF